MWQKDNYPYTSFYLLFVFRCMLEDQFFKNVLFCWYIYPLSSLMSLHLFLYSFLFGSNSLSSFKSNQSQKVENASKMQKYALKMKAEVLDSRWYLFVCWLHMFGFGFPGFAGFPPSDRHSTLPANTLATITPHPHRISGISSPLMISKTQKYI